MLNSIQSSAIRKNITVRSFIILFCLMAANFCFGQTAEYYNLIKQADSLYKVKAYTKSAFTYSSAFRVNNGMGIVTDRYNAACSWALANYPDSAFFQLNRISSKGNYMNYNAIISDSDLNSLHNDNRWMPILDAIKKNKKNAESNLNQALIRQLDTIYNDDQKYRQIVKEKEAKYGRESKQVAELKHIISQKDSINLIKTKLILDKYGWLGADVVGARGSITLFLVIQHANLKTQQKYLPLVKEAEKNGKIQGTNLAFLEDRIAIGEGKKQIYGTQIYRNQKTGTYFIAPIEDEVNVDKRRSLIGLEPIAEYVKQWNIIYRKPK